MLKRLKKRFLADHGFTVILTGTAWSVFAQVLAACFGMLSTIIVVREYGAGVLGIVAMLNSFMLIGTIFSVLGTSTAVLRLVPEHLVKYSVLSAYRVYRKIIYIVVFSSLLLGGLSYIGSMSIAEYILHKPYLNIYLSMASVVLVFKSLALLNTQAVRSLRLIKWFSLMHFLPQGGNFFLLLMLTYFISSNDVPIYAYLGAFVITAVVGIIVMELEFKKKINITDTIGYVSVKEILSMSIPMLLTSVMTFVIGQTGVIMLGVFKSDTDVGYYAVAVKFATLTAFFLSAVNSMVAPRISELYFSGDIDELNKLVKKSAGLIFWATTPILLLLIVFGEPFLSTFFGREFVAAYPALVMLAIGQFFSSIAGSSGLFMNMTGNHKIMSKIMVLSAVMNFSLSFFLVPVYGIAGASVSAMISLVVWNMLAIMYIKKVFGFSTAYIPGWVTQR